MRYLFESKKYLFAAMIAMAIILPHFATAQTTTADTCGDLKQKFSNAGGASVVANVPQYCTVESVYTKIINIALFAVGIAGVIAVVYGGYLYMTASANEAQKKKAKSVLTWAIVGLIVVIAAAAIVNLVVAALVDNQFV